MIHGFVHSISYVFISVNYARGAQLPTPFSVGFLLFGKRTGNITEQSLSLQGYNISVRRQRKIRISRKKKKKKKRLLMLFNVRKQAARVQYVFNLISNVSRTTISTVHLSRVMRDMVSVPAFNSENRSLFVTAL